MSESRHEMKDEEIAKSIVPIAPPVPAPRQLEKHSSREKAEDPSAIMDALVSLKTLSLDSSLHHPLNLVP